MSNRNDFFTKLNNASEDDIEETHSSDQRDNSNDESFYKSKGYPKIRKHYGKDVHTKQNGESQTMVYFDLTNFLLSKKLSFLIFESPAYWWVEEKTKHMNFLDTMAARNYIKTKEYNDLEPDEQYRKDNRSKIVLRSALGVVALSLIVYTVGIKIPEARLKKASSGLVSGDYQKAYDYYKNKDGDDLVYKYLAESFVLLNKGELEESSNAMSNASAIKYNAKLVDFNLVREEFYDQLGDAYVDQGDALSAVESYKENAASTKYRNKYYEYAYKTAKVFYEDENYSEAFYILNGITGYEDSAELLIDMGDSVYTQGMDLYHKKQYNQANEVFDLLASINFKNSKTMKSQLNYAIALDSYRAGDYDKTEDMLLSLGNFKDSNALLKDIQYRKGLSLLKDDYAKAYPYIYATANYRDSNLMLNHPSMVLFGHWNVISHNDVDKELGTLIYGLDRNLTLSGTLDEIKSSQVYTFDGTDKYISADGSSEIIVEVISSHKLKLKTEHHVYEVFKSRTVDEVYYNQGGSIKTILDNRVDTLLNRPFKPIDRSSSVDEVESEVNEDAETAQEE